MCNPAQELDNAFSTVTGWVDQTLSGIGKTLDAIAKDPLPTIATIALTAVGVPPVVTSLVRTAMTGGSMEDMVINMAVAYVGSEIGAAAGDAAVPELGNISGYGGAGDLAFQPTATDAILKSVISNASAQGATAILQGKDLNEVFNSALTGAVGGLINTSLRTEFGLDPSKFGDKLIGDATKAAVSSIFTGKDPGEAIGNALSKSAFGSLANAAASGLKSTFKDLQESSKEFETTKTEADGLRAEIDTESTRLSGLAGQLNSTSTALNSRQTNLAEAQSLLNLASNAYNGYFVSYDEAAQNAFAKRMGFEMMTDSDGNGAWIKGVTFSRNEYYDSEGNRHPYKLIFTPEGNIDYNAQVPTSYEYVNIGTEAQNIANQQAAYLNANIPQFKTDVEKFNTDLSKFNTDKSELDTKVTTYTGLVNDLFGEDGKGGLNKKIEDLLVARDGYLEDLDESLTSLTEAAGEEISGVAKEIADNAVDLLDQNYRSSDEVATAFAGLGYTPSAAEIARFVGEGDDATLSELLGVHVDQNSVDMAEARAAFQGTGYTPTDEELKQFIGQRAESGLEKDAAAFADPRVFDVNEVKALAQAEGIKLGARDILNLQKRGLIGVGDEVTLRNQLGAEFDNQFVTKNEARQYFQDLGYEVSEDDLNQFVGQRDESNTASTISNWVDERTVTRDEAEQAFKSVGYEPTEEELSRFLGNQSEKQVLDDIAEFGKERLRVTPPSPDKVLGEDGAAIPPSGSVAEYAAVATSDTPAKDISISQLPETMRPREGETVTDATYGPEGEVRVTMVGKRPDGTEYSYTAVQDPEDKSVFYETASGGEAGGATRISDTRPGGEEKPAENIVIAGTDGSTVTLSPDGSVLDVTDSDGTMPDNASDAQDVIDRIIADPVIEQPVVAPPVVEPSYTPGEDAQEFKPPVVEQPAVEQPVVEPSVVAPPVETVEGGTGADLGGGDDTKAGNIVITGEDGSTVTLSPDGSVVDVTDAEGNKPSNVQDVVADVISNPVNVETPKVGEGVEKVIDDIGFTESDDLPNKLEGKVDDLEETADYTDAINNALAGLDYATEEDVENIINLTLKANPNLTEKQVSNIVGGHLDQLDIPTDVDIQKIVNESINAAELASKTDVTDAITSALAGLDFADEADVKKAIDAALEANPSLTADQVSELIKAELKNNDLATDADVKKLAGDIADVQEGIAGLGLDYADKLATAVDSITRKVNEFESTGATRDEALSAALDNVASDLGLAREEFLEQLGETETTLGERIAKSETEFAEQLGGLQTELIAKIGALEEAGLSRDDAIKQSIASLAGELGETETGLLQKIGITESNLKTQLEGVSTEFGEKLGDIQEQITGQGLEYATKLSTAVDDINERMTEFESIGATRDEALQAAIDNVAENLGVTSEALLEQLNLNKTELQGQIEQANLDYAKQVAGLGTDITGVKTELETLGTKVGEQVGGLGTKVAGIEQTLAKQPEQWAKLFSDLQTGFGTQISGLQSQLARQNAQQRAAQQAAQQAAMAPKFETFYANIPGYKPFDLRQFSSDFFDEE